MIRHLFQYNFPIILKNLLSFAIKILMNLLHNGPLKFTLGSHTCIMEPGRSFVQCSPKQLNTTSTELQTTNTFYISKLKIPRLVYCT